MNGKFQMRLIKTGKVEQHTAEYKAKLKELGIVLPKVAFEKETPNFVVDITKLPEKILRDYGFIPNKVIESKKGEVIKKFGSFH